MARIIRMPSEAELPPGAKRDFVELLFVCYRAAARPALAKISKTIRDGDHRTTASTETIRLMLRGRTVPRNWDIVKAVGLALDEIEGADPDAEWDYHQHRATTSGHLRRYWNLALDEPEPEPAALAAEQGASAAGNRPIPSIRPGDLVSHDVYGLGRVLSMEGQGDDPEAKVDFGNEYGIKHLLLRYAPVEKL